MKCFSLFLSGCLISTIVSAQQANERYVGHQSAPYYVSLSPGGQRLVSTGFDESVRIWNVKSHSLATSFQEHQGIVLTAAFSPDETLLASGGLDRSIRLWDIPQSEPTTIHELVKFPVHRAVLSREAESLVLSGAEGQMVVWTTENQTALPELKSTISKPSHLAIRDNAQSVAVANQAGHVNIFSGNNLADITEIQAHRGELVDLRCSGNDTYFFTVGTDGYLRRWPTKPSPTLTWESPAEPLLEAEIDSAGQRLVTVSQSGKTQVWDVKQAKVLWEATEIPGKLSHPVISADRQWLLIIDEKQTPHLLQMSDGKLIRSVSPLAAAATALALSPNKKQIAAGFADGTVRIINAETGEELHNFSTGKTSVSHLDWHHASPLLFVATEGGQVQQWETTKAERKAEWTTSSALTAMKVQSRTNRIAVGSQQGGLVILSSDKLELVTEFPQQPSAIISLDLSSNGATLMSGDSSGVLTLWDTKTALAREHYFAGEKNLLSAAFLSDGSSLRISRSGDIQQQKGVVSWFVRIGEGSPLAMECLDNGNELAVLMTDGSIKTFNGSNGASGADYKGHSGEMTALAYAPNGSLFYAGNKEGVIYEWALSNHPLRQAYVVGKPIRAITLTQDSKRVIATTTENQIRSYPVLKASPTQRIDTETLAPTLQELSFGETAPLSFEVRDDHQTGWSVTEDGKVQEWKMANSESVATLSGHSGQVYSVAFSPDGTRLVSVSSDKTVRLWDLSTRKVIKTLATFDQVLYDVAYAPDGQAIFVCGADRLVRELDPESGQIRTSYEGSDETLYSIAVSADGKKICAAGTGLGPEREILVWKIGGATSSLVFPMKTDSIYSVQFESSGESLIAIGYNGHVERYSLTQKKSVGVLDIPFVLYSGCLSADEKSLILASDQPDLLTYPLPK